MKGEGRFIPKVDLHGSELGQPHIGVVDARVDLQLASNVSLHLRLQLGVEAVEPHLLIEAFDRPERRVVAHQREQVGAANGRRLAAVVELNVQHLTGQTVADEVVGARFVGEEAGVGGGLGLRQIEVRVAAGGGEGQGG